MGRVPSGDVATIDDCFQPKLAPVLDAVALGQVPMDPVEDRRQASIRRDLNDLVRGPDGKVAEAKVFAVLFKGAMIHVFLKHAETILKDWMILAVFVSALLMPDILKKLMSMKLGQPKESTPK